MTGNRRHPIPLHRLLKACAAAAALALGTACAGSLPVYPRQGFIDVPGGPVWYSVSGDGAGTPLVTLHGGPGGTSCSLQVLSPLGDERRVIRYDQLGTGRSGRPDDPGLWHRDRFVEELDTVVDALGLSEFHLLGHSWGGALAAYYFLETRDARVRSLILSSPLISTGKWLEDTGALRAQLPEDVQEVLDRHEAAGTTDSEAYRAATDIFYSLYFTRGDAVEDYQCPDAPGNSAIYLQMWGPTEFHATGNLQDFDVLARLPEISVPTLFITGEFDEARPQTVSGFAGLVPGARFEVLPGVGHATFTRVPGLYRRLVRDFLETVDAQDPG